MTEAEKFSGWIWMRKDMAWSFIPPNYQYLFELMGYERVEKK